MSDINAYGLLVVGFGVLQRGKNEGLTGKSVTVSYIHELGQWFRPATWATQIYDGPSIYRTPLVQTRVSPSIVSGNRKGLVSDYRLLRGLITKDTVILLSLPNPWLSLVLLLFRRSARGLFVYIAGNYAQYAEAAVPRHGILYSRLYRLWFETLLRRADGVIARGKLLTAKAKQLNANVIETFPIVDKLDESPSRQTGPCATHRIQLLYVGKLLVDKGVHILIEAFSRLRSLLPSHSIKLDIVGSGLDRGILEQLAHKFVLMQIINFHGYIDDPQTLSEFYNRADLVIVPSTPRYPEGVPRVLEEAMAHGVPVIASALHGITAQFKDEIVLVPPEDIEALTKAMHRLIYDKFFRRGLLAAADAHVRTGRTQSSAGLQHARFIIESLERKKAKV